MWSVCTLVFELEVWFLEKEEIALFFRVFVFVFYFILFRVDLHFLFLFIISGVYLRVLINQLKNTEIANFYLPKYLHFYFDEKCMERLRYFKAENEAFCFYENFFLNWMFGKKMDFSRVFYYQFF